jgi:hypothetical protein
MCAFAEFSVKAQDAQDGSRLMRWVKEGEDYQTKLSSASTSNSKGEDDEDDGNGDKDDDDAAGTIAGSAGGDISVFMNIIPVVNRTVVSATWYECLQSIFSLRKKNGEKKANFDNNVLLGLVDIFFKAKFRIIFIN